NTDLFGRLSTDRLHPQKLAQARHKLLGLRIAAHTDQPTATHSPSLSRSQRLKESRIRIHDTREESLTSIFGNHSPLDKAVTAVELKNHAAISGSTLHHCKRARRHPHSGELHPAHQHQARLPGSHCSRRSTPQSVPAMHAAPPTPPANRRSHAASARKGSRATAGATLQPNHFDRPYGPHTAGRMSTADRQHQALPPCSR